MNIDALHILKPLLGIDAKHFINNLYNDYNYEIPIKIIEILKKHNILNQIMTWKPKYYRRSEEFSKMNLFSYYICCCNIHDVTYPFAWYINIKNLLEADSLPTNQLNINYKNLCPKFIINVYYLFRYYGYDIINTDIKYVIDTGHCEILETCIHKINNFKYRTHIIWKSKVKFCEIIVAQCVAKIIHNIFTYRHYIIK